MVSCRNEHDKCMWEKHIAAKMLKIPEEIDNLKRLGVKL
jgi:hypothetical protein